MVGTPSTPILLAGRDTDLDSQPRYSPWTALAYIFNLIVGTGALALPLAFAQCGALLASVTLILLAFVSYLTATYVIEAMAVANAIILLREQEQDDLIVDVEETPTGPLATAVIDTRSSAVGLGIGEDGDSTEEPDSPLLRSSSSVIGQSRVGGASATGGGVIMHPDGFEIIRCVEMAHMSQLYLSRFGQLAFYLSLSIYLYGDLSIYSVVVAQSVTDNVLSLNSTLIARSVGPKGMFNLTLILFTASIGSLAFFNLSKTKYLQLSAIALRWSAFTTMIVIAIGEAIHPTEGSGGWTQSPIPGFTGSEVSPTSPQPPSSSPAPTPEPSSGSFPLANFGSLPTLFGVAVYSFMCHHSLPSLVQPVRHKRSLPTLLLVDYTLITTFYLLLALTALAAFPPQSIRAIYTLNFVHYPGWVVSRFLSLFPVFTLSSSYPIIAVTLKNNLRALFAHCCSLQSLGGRWVSPSRSLTLSTPAADVAVTLLAILPPFVIALSVSSLSTLVNITGCLFGNLIQYVFPCLLVAMARKGPVNPAANPFKSPLGGQRWLGLVLGWAVLSSLLVIKWEFF